MGHKNVLELGSLEPSIKVTFLQLMAFRRTTGRFTANLQSTTPRFFWDGTDNRKDAFGLVIIAVEEVLSSRDQGFDRGKEFIVRNFTAKVIIDVGRLGGGSHVQYPLWKNA